MLRARRTNSAFGAHGFHEDRTNGEAINGRRLRIAMVCDFFHPAVGGVENHIFMLASQLLFKGHKVIVITHSHPPNRVGVRWLVPGIKVYYVPLKTIASNATLPNFITSLPYMRPILLRERIEIIHGHASLSSMAHEGILHAWHMGIRTVFTDHSLFALDDAVGILTNKLLEAALCNVDATICVSYTGRENTVLRGQLKPSQVFVIPNAVVADKFRPAETPPPKDSINIVVVSRLAYRKGVDLLVSVVPRICAAYPDVHFIIGGDGPKLSAVLEMRDRRMLQDRVHLLGAVKHEDVRSVLIRGSIFLNTSLTEAFGVAIVEAACAGLHVVSTRVGGVPEILPEDMISFALPEENDVFAATCRAIDLVSHGGHDPLRAHERIRHMYSWRRVAERTEVVYSHAMQQDIRGYWPRLQRNLQLGKYFGVIFAIILTVDCLFYAFLEWLIPVENIDFVEDEWHEQNNSEAHSA